MGVDCKWTCLVCSHENETTNPHEVDGPYSETLCSNCEEPFGSELNAPEEVE
jgi:transcription elongation factor Elf1